MPKAKTIRKLTKKQTQIWIDRELARQEESQAKQRKKALQREFEGIMGTDELVQLSNGKYVVAEKRSGGGHVVDEYEYVVLRETANAPD